ncbi:MAG: hypothetical protein CVV25_04655 [Ignavibacteriae bacterium HGW-Ignavibacteriae-4]|jgi:uncharacterized protein (TIGR04255 family)|nr:MAG: hypothetical protein CVV25_04655 [Ignavibacteriae bacterium HGW-Ignavibacteriae-4]
MSKDLIRRKQLKKNMMKNVIFRIDYQGIINSEDIIKSFKDNFKDKFKIFQTTFHSKIDFDINNIEDISDTLSIPIKEIQKQEIYRFTDNTFGNDELTLDISKYFTVLTVNCQEYEGIDEYLDFFSSFIDFLFENSEYLQIKRIGLRKIGGEIYFDEKEIYRDFEQKYFNFNFIDTPYNSFRSRHIDVLKLDDKSPIINYVRSFEAGNYHDNETNIYKSAFQVLLDIDAYYSDFILEKIKFKKGMAKQVLTSTNNEHLFKIFKMSVTEAFLKANSNE